jgi:hypothetical protein
MTFTHMNHIEPDDVMNIWDPNDPYGLPHILMSEQYKLMLAKDAAYREANPTPYKGRSRTPEQLDEDCNEAEEANKWYR